MHERIRKFHDDLALNEAGGRIASAYFRRNLHCSVSFHEAHHDNNRTVFERFDYYDVARNRFLKYAQWLLYFTAFYWIRCTSVSL